MASRGTQTYKKADLLSSLQKKMEQAKQMNEEAKTENLRHNQEKAANLMPVLAKFLADSNEETSEAVRSQMGDWRFFRDGHFTRFQLSVDFVETYPNEEMELTLAQYADLMEGATPR